MEQDRGDIPYLLDLRTLPKVELHRHLKGAVRLSTIIDLAREAGVDLPGARRMRSPPTR